MLPVLALIAIMAVPALPLTGAPSPGTPTRGTLHPTRDAVAAFIPSAAASTAPSAQGPGLFFSNQPIPLPPIARRTCAAPGTSGGCAAGALLNVTNDVSANVTRSGLLAVAYTALTNDSPCASASRFSRSNVGFAVSKDNGTTWSTPVYLGNPDCGSAAAFPSAWQPSLTSLPNGTLALAYIEYNGTAGMLPPLLNASAPPPSRLVLTESYDNGTNWTDPVVLNSSSPDPTLYGVSFPPLRPSLTAFGRTLYLSWMTLGDPYVTAALPSRVSLLVSTDAGVRWSPVVPMGVAGADSINPQVFVAPNGTLYVAYSTNVDLYCAGCGGSATVVVASSPSNGTVFSTRTVAVTSPIPVDPSIATSQGADPFLNPAPQLAYDAATKSLLVGFVGAAFLCGSSGCADYALPMLYASGANGTTWAARPGVERAFAWANSSNAASENRSGATDLALTVTSAGTVVLETSYLNASWCGAGACGIVTEEMLESPDGGLNWTHPVMLSGATTPSGPSGGGPPGWGGEYESAVTHAGRTWFAWVSQSCPGWASTPCGGYPGGPQSLDQVEVSEPRSPGNLSVTFVPSGLPSATNWSVDLLGNYRTGNGSTPLVVSGVPSGVPLQWMTPSPVVENATARFEVTSQGPLSPRALTSNATVYENFSRYVPLTVDVSPSYLDGSVCSADWPYACTTYFGEGVASIYGPPEHLCAAGAEYPGLLFVFQMTCTDLNVSPVAPGTVGWIRAGQPFELNASRWDPIRTICLNFPGNVPYCGYDVTNLSFLGWEGSGPGSVTSTSRQITLDPTDAPLRETVVAFPTGGCTPIYRGILPGISCWTTASSLSFQERGLPPGTPWAVTVANSTGPPGTGWTRTSNSASATEMTFQGLNASDVGYTAWDVPGPSPGQYWVARADAPPVIPLPYLGAVLLNFTLVDLAGTNVTLNLSESGLPAGMAWSYVVENASTSTDLSATTSATFVGLTVPAGAVLSANASPLFEANGSSYYLESVNVSPFTVNASAQGLVTPPWRLTLWGDARVTFHFGIRYWLTTSGAGVGGSVAPGSEWVPSGDAVTLAASPAPGYVFVGWTGYGSGSSGPTTDPNPSITVRPLGPVVESATFAPAPPPSWEIAVTGTGIPSDQNFSVTLGPRTYTGHGAFLVTNLTSGDYAVRVPYAYASPFPDVRWTADLVRSTFPSTSGGELVVGSDGNLTVGFAQQDLLTLAATSGGRIAPSPGLSWNAAGASLELTATPDPGFVFLGWSGTGNGSASGATPSVTVTFLSPLRETAAFGRAPAPPPPTFSLELTESGLPAGTSWSAAVGLLDLSGAGVSLAVDGVAPGAYGITIPAVYGPSGVRYQPLNTTASVSVSGNVTVPVSFETQFLVTVGTTTGGTCSLSGTRWAANGTTMGLVAAPDPGYRFVGWTGTESAPGGNLSVTVSSPVTETASFVKVPAPTASAGTVPGTVAAGVLAAALAAGVVVAAVRRRRLGRRHGGTAGGRPPANPYGGGPAPPERRCASLPDFEPG